MNKSRWVFMGLALALGAVSPGASVAAAAERASIQAILNGDGSGQMIVNSQTNPADEVWSWEACASDLSTCTPFTTGRIVETTGASPETVFRATSNYGATTLSPLWHGNTSPLMPPTVSGVVRANRLVTPVPGQWAGGWDGGDDAMQLAACLTPKGYDCTTLTHSHYISRCPNEAAVIDPMFTGQYLHVADQRQGPPPHTVFPYGVLAPYGRDVWQTGPAVSIAIVGRVAKATGPRTVHCGPPPLVKAYISKRGVAAVRCWLDCRAVLIAKRGHRILRRPHELTGWLRTEQPNPERWSIPRQRLLQAGLSGPVAFIVEVDGKRVAQRMVLVPADR